MSRNGCFYYFLLLYIVNFLLPFCPDFSVKERVLHIIKVQIISREKISLESENNEGWYPPPFAMLGWPLFSWVQKKSNALGTFFLSLLLSVFTMWTGWPIKGKMSFILWLSGVKENHVGNFSIRTKGHMWIFT